MIEVVNVGTREVAVRGTVKGGVREEGEIILPGAAVHFERVIVAADLVVKRAGARVEVAAD